MTNTIEIDDLTVRYRGRPATVAVDGLSLGVREGEIVGLLGPNGAGKTSTLKTICSLIYPTSGTVRVAGHDVARDPKIARQLVSLVLEGERNMYWRVTTRGNLEYFAALAGFGPRRARPVIDELMDRLRLPNVAARKLSRGMKQKLVLACALVRQTPILLLDEPTLGLDVDTSIELRSWIRDLAATQGKTIVLSSHDMRVVQDVCPRVVVLNKGRCVADERVETLIDAMQGSTYRFRIASPLGDENRRAVERDFPGASVDSLTVDVDLPTSDDIYRFVETLRSLGVSINGIDRARTELEAVYRDLVRDV